MRTFVLLKAVMCRCSHTYTYAQFPITSVTMSHNFLYISLSWFTSENCDCFCCIERETNTAGPAVSSQGVHHEASSCLGKWLCHDLDSLFVCKLTLFRSVLEEAWRVNKVLQQGAESITPYSLTVSTFFFTAHQTTTILIHVCCKTEMK